MALTLQMVRFLNVKLILFLIWMGLGVIKPVFAHQLIELNEAVDSVSLRDHFEIYRDKSGTKNIFEISSADYNNKFVPLQGDLATGFTTDTIWLKFHVNRLAAAPAQWLLELQPPYLDEVTLYIPEIRGGFLSHTTGDHYPEAEQGFRSNNLVLSLNPPANQRVTYYLRMKTSSTLFLQAKLWQPKALAEQTFSEIASIGVYFGAAVITLILMLGYLYVTGDELVRSFTSVLANNFVGTSLWTGFLSPYLFRLPGWLADLLTGLPVIIGVALGCWFAQVLLRLSNGHAKLENLLKITGWLSLVLVLPSIVGFHHLAAPIAHGVALILLLISPWMLLRMIQSGQTQAWLFATMWVGHGVISILLLLRNLAVFPHAPWILHSFLMSWVFHMAIAALVVTFRLQRAETALIQSQEEAIVRSRRVEQDLEDKVFMRTAALAETTKALGLANDRIEAALKEEQAARQSQRQFLSMLTHEFKTPLAVIDRAVQMVTIKLDNPPEGVLSRLNLMRDNVRRLVQLIDTWLNHDALESGRLQPRLEDVVLAKLLPEAVEQMADRHAVGRVNIFIDENVPKLKLDRQMMLLALTNLLDNAAKYSAPASEIDLRLILRGNRVGVEVIDHGVGIPENEISRVGERFFRASTTHDVAGTGLGVDIVKRVVALHGGQLDIWSQVGEGTMFSIWLPVPKDQFTPSPRVV